MKYLPWMLLLVSVTGQSADMDYPTLVASSGKVVTFRASIAPYPEQHPTGLFNHYDPKTQTIQRKHETYATLQPHDPQIVLVSTQAITCPASITINGIAQWIDLDGKPNRKTSYARVWVTVITAICD